MREADQLRLERDQLRDLLGRHWRAIQDLTNMADWITPEESRMVDALAAQARPIRQRCAECTCENGGVDCNWIARHPVARPIRREEDEG